MKRRLFWKILFGFWLTFFLIIHGVWLLFAALRSEPSPFMKGVAAVSVAAAGSALERGGMARYQAEAAAWPSEIRERLSVLPDGPRIAGKPLEERALTLADGRRYRIAFHADGKGKSIFDVPREVVIIGALGGLLFSAILAWYLTAPVHRLRAGFRQLAQGDFQTRLSPEMGRRRDEIADLAVDFDLMAAQLGDLVSARNRLLADVSHELRTPLARLNLAIGLAKQDPEKLRSSLDRIASEARKLDEMVGELLTLSKLESSAGELDEYYDLAEIVRAVAADAAYEAQAKQVSLVMDVQEPDADFLARGNGKLVSRAIENVVRNALRYSPVRGVVALRLARDAYGYGLAITDDGPGIPEENIANLFKPFADSADGFGFGLGLAIAERAISVHGGKIAARNRPGKGLEVSIALPAIVSPDAVA